MKNEKIKAEYYEAAIRGDFQNETDLIDIDAVWNWFEPHLSSPQKESALPSEWINVEDRLPESWSKHGLHYLSDNVLILDAYGDIEIDQLVTICEDTPNGNKPIITKFSNDSVNTGCHYHYHQPKTNKSWQKVKRRKRKKIVHIADILTLVAIVLLRNPNNKSWTK